MTTFFGSKSNPASKDNTPNKNRKPHGSKLQIRNKAAALVGVCKAGN